MTIETPEAMLLCTIASGLKGFVGFVRFVVQGSEVSGPRMTRRTRMGSRKRGRADSRWLGWVVQRVVEPGAGAELDTAPFGKGFGGGDVLIALGMALEGRRGRRHPVARGGQGQEAPLERSTESRGSPPWHAWNTVPMS